MSGLVLGGGVTLLLWLAALLQLAVIRDRTVIDSHSGESCRWLVAAGVGGLAGRFSWLLLTTARLDIPWHSLLSIGLLALGLIGLALEKFLPHPFDRHHRHRQGSR